MTQVDPHLLSLLHKVAHPLSQLNLQITVNGVYAAPEEWKNTDEANPNVFTYTLNAFNEEFEGGKIQPRKIQLTEKEQREAQEKNKKGGKKQTKEEEKVIEEDPEEVERKRIQWEALSEQERFYCTQEDPFKNFSLKFNPNIKDSTLNSESISELQAKVENGEMELILIRKPNMTEDEVAKLIKSKPKNLNIAELYTAKYRGILNLDVLKNPGTMSFNQRVKMQQAGEVPQGCLRIDAGDCYVNISVVCSQPLTPEVKEIKPTPEIIPEWKQKKDNISGIQKLKGEIVRSIRAISQQYTSCFVKQKQHQDERKHSNLNSISTLRLNEINKKKELFLNQFVNSGKYNTLRERISEAIKTVVIEKFRKEKSNSPFKAEQINMTLSQLNLFFQQEFSRTIDEFMNTQNHLIHEDLVLGHQNSRQTRKHIISPIINETEEERQMRLAWQLETLQMGEKAEENYINIMLINSFSLESKEMYANFCLKNKKFDEAYVLYEEIAAQSKQYNHRWTLAVLLVERKRVQKSMEVVGELMEEQESKADDKIMCNLLLSFMFEREGNRKRSEKYLGAAEKYYKIKENPNLKLNPPQNPYLPPTPSIPKPDHYTSILTHHQSQQIRLHFVNLLTNLNLFNLVEEYMGKLEDSHKKSVLEIEIDIFYQRYDEALNKVNILLSKGDNIRNIDLLMMKADICYRDEKMFECEEIFLSILQLKPPSSKTIGIYLRLGYTYLNRKSWEDAKRIFEKACEQKYNCSLAWQGLGVACLNLGHYPEAEQALNLTKIYNSLSTQTNTYQEQIDKYYKAHYSQEYPHLNG